MTSPTSPSDISLPQCSVFWTRLLPFLRWWPRVNRNTLKADLVAGFTGAVIVLPQGVAFATVAKFAEPGSAKFIQMALTLTFLAGVYQFVLGLARMGTLVNFVSHSVVVGFTAGAAILIATSQLKHFFGINIPAGESFLHTWQDIFLQI